MLDLKIKMLKNTYGYTNQQISELLEIPLSAVRIGVESEYEEEVPQATLVPADNAITPELVGQECEDGESGYATGIEALKAGEVSKQQETAPIMAMIELSLLERLKHTIECSEYITPEQLCTLVDAFKKLTKDSVVNAVVKQEKSNVNAGAPQVVLQVMQFQGEV